MTRDPAVTSRIMSSVRSTGTRPELILRRELFRRGLRYRVRSTLIGRPDVVFPGARVACFVDGDRWHGNGWRIRGFDSFEDEFAHRNSDFWKQKIIRNMARDVEVTDKLQSDGWLVIRIWASDVEADPIAVADKVERSVLDRRARTT
ncbi:very short patch repair endonuclease [Nocardioides sp. SOB77]|uniref:Very short patch repair endonuclease n=1 Tax=Nocardioides oceani TaxID=3058369 RepID=A0ABT8FCD8_9ACTN|nr:very short patch repair endonuclease [Nocardioides oceani]MDN4172256.1 very short patch repair endonuclease [Nocardioides oceani]